MPFCGPVMDLQPVQGAPCTSHGDPRDPESKKRLKNNRGVDYWFNWKPEERFSDGLISSYLQV